MAQTSYSSFIRKSLVAIAAAAGLISLGAGAFFGINSSTGSNVLRCTDTGCVIYGLNVIGSLLDDGAAVGGLSQANADARYVNTSGDTMTGAMTINLASGTLGLNVKQTASAATLQSTIRCPMTLEFSAASGSAVTSGSGVAYGSITIPPSGSGQILKSASVKARTKGVTGVTLFKAYNHTKGKNQLLSSPVRLEPGKFTSTGAYTISAVNNVSGGDEVIVYVPTVASTAPSGVNFTLNFDCQ